MKRITLSLHIILTIVGMFCIPENSTAQRANSLYFLERTPFHNQWNPAMAPLNPGFGIGVSNISLSVQSDLALSDIFTPSADGTELYTFMHPSVDKGAFVGGLNDITSLSLSSKIDLFNMGIRILNNCITVHSSIAFDAGIGIPKDFFKMFLLGMDNNVAGTNFDLTDMNINAMTYAKTGVGYSMNIGKMFSVGINANYLEGLADMRMGFNQLTVDASETQWDIISKGYIQMAAPDIVKFKYNEDGYFNGMKKGNSFKSSSSIKSGSGFSVDLGVTAKLLPFLTLSAAIIDLGSIKWDPSCIERATADGSYTFDGVDFEESNDNQSSTEAMDSFEDMIHFEKDNNPKSYSSKLTTKLNIGAEAGILNDHITFGVLSQTGFAENGTYQDIMLSANLKPSKIIQGALTYSLLHGEMSSFGAAINTKLLIFNIFAAADYIPFKYSRQMIPVNNSYYNMELGFNLMF